MVWEATQELQDNAANSNANYLWKDTHSRPYAMKLASFIGWRYDISDQRPINTGICSITNSEESSSKESAILTLKEYEKDANNSHHRT